jgi:hypothetical protein
MTTAYVGFRGTRDEDSKMAEQAPVRHPAGAVGALDLKKMSII